MVVELRTYNYSPSIKAYVAVDGKNSTKYYDLSSDIQTCVINRKTDDCSDGNIILANKGRKYNELFSPFDRIVVFTTKGGHEYRLLTGYITKVTNWTLTDQDMRIYFSDTLYRLKCLYFDPGLSESKKALGNAQIGWDFGSQMYSILMNIADWPVSMINIDREIPAGVQSWARELYVAQKSDYEQSEQIVQEMFQTIMSSTSAISAMGGGLNTDGSFGTATMTGDTNAERLWTYFTSLGFTKECTAGIIGNAMQESGINPDDDGWPAIGVFQFEVNVGEHTGLYRYADEHGMKWNDIKCQCDYLMTLLPSAFDSYTGRSPYYYDTGEWVWWPQKMTLQEFSQIKDVALAAEIFCKVYERPSIQRLEKRIQYAKDAYASFA